MKLAVIGAGAIGLTHCDTITSVQGVTLTGISDPSPAAGAIAMRYGTRHYPDHRSLIVAERPDGAVIATPNELHVSIACDFLEAGIPILVEKPVANSVAEALVLLEAAERTGVPVLVGHHRRHHLAVVQAKSMIEAGALGTIVVSNISYNLFKPQDYFEASWRRRPGVGGPFLINAIHEVDLLRHLVGEIAAVSVLASNSVRGFEVEDSGAILFRFETGAIGALTVSDTAAAPWSWDLSSGDVPRFPKHDVTSHRISGTDAALTLPKLELWRHAGAKSWTTQMTPEIVEVAVADPFVRQLGNFSDVIAGRAPPMVPLREGIRNMSVLEAIGRAAKSRREEAVQL